jgi:RNA polymerase sigma-70 factor (ECF subfamily)
LPLAERKIARQTAGKSFSGTKMVAGTLTPKQVIRGDLDLERLTNEHYAALYRFALSLCAHESDAADLVQETFYLLATKGHQLQDAAKARSWLFTTLHRLFLGRRRRLVRFPHHELTEVEGELPELPPEPVQVDWPTILEGLARLDERFRGPIALFYLEDYSYDDIARTLELPLGTVKSRIARGLAQLQRMMVERAMTSEGATNL